MKKITMVLAVMMLLVSANAKQVYFKAPHWDSAGAKFGVHSWGTGEEVDALMTKVEGTDIYEATVDEGAHSYIFLRLSDKAANFDWSKEWNRTPNQENVTGNLCTVINNSWGNPGDGSGCEVEWTTYNPVEIKVTLECKSVPLGTHFVGQAVDFNVTPQNIENPTYKYYVKTDGDFAETALPYTLGITADETYIFKVEAYEGADLKATSAELTVIPRVLPTTVYIKHPWLGTDWSYQSMIAGESGIFTYEGKWGNNGANINGVDNDGGAYWFAPENIIGASDIGEAVVDVIFEYNVVAASLSVAKKSATSLDQSSLTSRIFAQGRMLNVTIEGEAQVAIYSMDGKMIEHTMVFGNYTREMNSGMYFVRVNDETHKVVVK